MPVLVRKMPGSHTNLSLGYFGYFYLTSFPQRIRKFRSGILAHPALQPGWQEQTETDQNPGWMQTGAW